ncbi:hypothetical protein ScPMuIL_015898 [Solemya velum]
MSCKEDMRERATKFFKDADTDGSGCLKKIELYKIVQNCGFDKTPEEVTDWFVDVDVDQDGRITMGEFIKSVVEDRPISEVSDADLRASFKEIDRDDTGHIDRNELRAFLDARPHKKRGISDEQLEEDLNEIDSSGDGKISIEEYIAMVREQAQD